MSFFINAMDNNNIRVGVNGSDVYDKPNGKQQELLALFSSLNRDINTDVLKTLISSAQKTSSLEDLVVLAFYTRDILEGKGERDLFYFMFHELYKDFPKEILKTMTEIPNYGSWFDFQKLIHHGILNGYMTTCENNKSMSDSYMIKKFENHPMVEETIQLYSKQILEDSENKHNLTLAAKWIPREGKRHGWIGELVAKSLYPYEFMVNRRGALKKFREVVSGINKKLNTVERLMCHDKVGLHNFSDIQPSQVPSRCLKMKRKAFFNENNDGSIRNLYDTDRMLCRNRFLEHIKKSLKGETGVHGRVLMPHEFIIALEKGNHTVTELDSLEAQWIDLQKSILDKGTLGKTIVMCDFSGSMYGMPMSVSKGLGLLCSECTSPAFQDRILTFDSKPTWHNLSNYTSLYDRIKSFEHISQGTSTNFQAAVELILNRLIEAKVPVGEEPDVLLVLTDMGWDQASGDLKGGFETHIDRIKKQFQTAGGWKVPTIIIWNISGKFQEFHHESETLGTCTISGWSPTVLKYILNGDNIQERLKTLTPLSMMRQVLDNVRYDAIRKIIRAE